MISTIHKVVGEIHAYCHFIIIVIIIMAITVKIIGVIGTALVLYTLSLAPARLS